MKTRWILYKACLAAKGYSQCQLVFYEETFGLIPKSVTIELIAIAMEFVSNGCEECLPNWGFALRHANDASTGLLGFGEGILICKL